MAATAFIVLARAAFAKCRERAGFIAAIQVGKIVEECVGTEQARRLGLDGAWRSSRRSRSSGNRLRGRSDAAMSFRAACVREAIWSNPGSPVRFEGYTVCIVDGPTFYHQYRGHLYPGVYSLDLNSSRRSSSIAEATSESRLSIPGTFFRNQPFSASSPIQLSFAFSRRTSIAIVSRSPSRARRRRARDGDGGFVAGTSDAGRFAEESTVRVRMDDFRRTSSGRSTC